MTSTKIEIVLKMLCFRIPIKVWNIGQLTIITFGGKKTSPPLLKTIRAQEMDVINQTHAQ